MPAPPGLSVVVPCFREAEALEVLAGRLGEVPGDEVLFVDDGSDDATPAALARLAAADPRVRVLTHPRNLGVGAAMRTGAAASRGRVVVFYDADRGYALGDVARLVAALRPGVAVAGASPALGSARGVPWGRRLLTRLAHRSWRLATGRRGAAASVFTCAFRAWDGDFLRRLDWRSDGFPAAAEMLARALLAGARLVEVPAELRPRREGRSKMRVVRAALGHLGAQARVLGLRLTGRAQGPGDGRMTRGVEA